MTQTAPPAPFQGIAVAPTAIASGATATIPFPTDPSGGPVPWRTPWLVLLNSSPYTLLVATGATTTQIAAFTSDKVYVFAQGTGGPPVTITAQGGAGTPSPASDSTVYATWYQGEPPGSYPAALGSGAVTDVFESQVVTGVTIPIAHGVSIGSGPFKTTGFGGVAVEISETTGNGPLTVQMFWFSSPAILLVAQRTVIIPAGGLGAFSLPNVGPLFSITITNANGSVALAYDIVVGFTPNATATWSVALPGATTTSVLIPATGTSIPNNVDTVNAISPTVYAGPALWWTFWNNTTVGFAHLDYQDGAGTWHVLAEVDLGSTATSNQLLRPPPMALYVPPNPLRIAVTQTSGGPTLPFFTLTADDYRIAC